jgi:hypothetical protein
MTDPEGTGLLAENEAAEARADRVARLMDTTRPERADVIEQVSAVLARLYGAALPDEAREQTAIMMWRWMTDALDGVDPRRAQLYPRDEAEASYALQAALSLSPELTDAITASVGLRIEMQQHYVQAFAVLTNLDRCQHGRHSVDSCLSCPGGQSAGNPHMRPGAIVGYDYRGRVIAMPVSPADRVNPDKWISGSRP